MPARKRGALSLQSYSSQRQKRLRAQETQEQREIRLHSNAARILSQRQQEGEEERHTRLQANAARTVRRRQQEGGEARQARLQSNAARTARRRQQEGDEARQARLQSNAVRMSASRAQSFNSSVLKNCAYNYSDQVHYSVLAVIEIGSMSQECQHCKARKWKGEPPSMCCSNGKVSLPLLAEPPDPLKTLLEGNSSESNAFLKRIRIYNSGFQMTSFRANIIFEGGFMPSFKVQGQVYHSVGSLLPASNQQPQFLQIYFVGSMHEQADLRCAYLQAIERGITMQLQEMIHITNSYVRSFKYAMEMSPSPDLKLVINADKRPMVEHRGRFNPPNCNEVAVIMNDEECGRRDIVLKLRDNTIKRINETHRSYDPLQYPLICVYGEDGYHFGIPHTQGNKTVSCMHFYAYMFMTRANYFNHLHRSQDLFQQYAVDMYAKVEAERLLYIKTHQKELRVDSYIHLRDSITNENINVLEIGKRCILPSSFTGGPRYMHERTQDAMTYVRTYGKPDLFITFTCNPTWKEIKAELFHPQSAKDRPDLIARIFRLKLTAMMQIIKKSQVFGPIRCDMYTIEWQKRGLPHAHILLWLENKIHADRIDSIISAELPDPETDPVLFNIIKSTMVHGPCGNFNKNAPCMVDGRCIKRYPRQLLKETQTGIDGYPLYKRRQPSDGGICTKMKINSGIEVDIDNRWIVPYCPLLSKAFDAHINVEFCNSIKSIKYVCKYVNKGSDAAMYAFQDQNIDDEVSTYQSGRYISSSEAFWRMFGFLIHERHPAIQQLSVHLENGQRVYFNEENALQQVTAPKNTTLTAFFQLCQNDGFARTLLYSEVPSYFTWNNNKWNRRKRGDRIDGQPNIYKDHALARIYTIHPSQQECFYLRMLLLEVRGPTSFQNLKTVDGRVCTTYREACFLRGLLEDDAHWQATMAEAAVSKSPKSLRLLFVILLHVCSISNPLTLWQNHKDNLSEDFLHSAQAQNPSAEVTYNNDIYNLALAEIEDKLLSLGGRELSNYGLPAVERNNIQNLCREVTRELSYNIEILNSEIEANTPKLLPDQRAAFDAVVVSIENQQGKLFFLDAPGGTGKTFVLRTLLAKVRKNSQIAIAVASSGIAATLLPGGRTAHATFKLPLNLAVHESPLCNISKGSGQSEVLKQCQLIVWDECTMAHKAALEALDRTLQDICGNSKIMGGKTIVLAGDFRQTLPIIPRGTRADEIKACLKSSHLWQSTTQYKLRTNMRTHLFKDQLSDKFASDLLRLGNGEIETDSEGNINLSDLTTIVTSIDELKFKVFENLNINYRNCNWLCERAILAPKNATVNIINFDLLQQLPGTERIYNSIDVSLTDEDTVNYPTEFLNSLEPSGLPPHRLILKEGAPVILLRNLDPPKLCNGTRLIVKQMLGNIIEAIIITGCGKGENVFIPRIPLIPTDLPFPFKRLQFPIRLSFAMSINKSQGQTLKVAGLQLEEPCFTHGQLYVGCSRVGSPNNLYVYAPSGKTKNIVYKESLL